MLLLNLLQWFSDNQMKANPDKCYLTTIKSEDSVINGVNEPITDSKCKKLLGVKIDNKLTFSSYIDGLCQKASQE